jgi:hypothetical protein
MCLLHSYDHMAARGKRCSKGRKMQHGEKDAAYPRLFQCPDR